MQPTESAGLPDPKVVLLFVLGIVTVGYIVFLAKAYMRRRAEDAVGVAPTPPLLATGFITNFFDTLGIGSFATTTAIFRQWKLVRDEYLPGTLNVGHTLPTIAQAFIYMGIVQVDPVTLIGMIVAAVLGAWVGAGVVAKWPRRRVQLGMGITLSIAALVMLFLLVQGNPAGGDLLKIEGTRLAAGVAGNFVLGALMTIGIGLYAPCMILVSLLGMNPTAAFPIMMGSCAFLMPMATVRFVKAKRYDPKAVLGLLIGGIPAVLLAAYIVKSLPLNAVRWLVIVVVLYTAANLLRTAFKSRKEGESPEGAPEKAVA